MNNSAALAAIGVMANADAMHQHLMRTGRKLYGPLSRQLTGAASGWRVMRCAVAELSPNTKREAAKLAAEIRHFLHGYRQMRGLDPKYIYSIHLGDDMEAHLRVSRLARIADLLESAQ